MPNDADVRQPGRIEVYVREVRQLFHSLDPSPFYDRDLDDDAAAFIVDSAREHPRDAPLSLVVYVEQVPESEETSRVVNTAVHTHTGGPLSARGRRCASF